MLPLFPVPIFQKFVPPFIWGLLPLIILVGLILYFSTALPTRFNEKKIAKSLEEYKSRNGDRYPESLKELVPELIKELPLCPAEGKETYSEGYRVSGDRSIFTIICKSTHHSRWSDYKRHYFFPEYDSIKGEVEYR